MRITLKEVIAEFESRVTQLTADLEQARYSAKAFMDKWSEAEKKYSLRPTKGLEQYTSEELLEEVKERIIKWRSDPHDD